jgi:hypothetical protein
MREFMRNITLNRNIFVYFQGEMGHFVALGGKRDLDF